MNGLIVSRLERSWCCSNGYAGCQSHVLGNKDTSVNGKLTEAEARAAKTAGAARLASHMFQAKEVTLLGPEAFKKVGRMDRFLE